MQNLLYVRTMHPPTSKPKNHLHIQQPSTPIRKNPQTINLPKHIRERRRILRDILLTSRRQVLTLSPILAGELSTKRRIKNNLMVLEMRINVAPTCEHRRWLPPRVRIRIGSIETSAIEATTTTSDIGRDLLTREVPDLDSLGCPFHREDTAAHAIEGGAKSVGSWVDLGATLVLLLVLGVDIAVRRLDDRGLRCVLDGAVAGRVQGHHVLDVGVDAFDDIDFALLWPGAAA